MWGSRQIATLVEPRRDAIRHARASGTLATETVANALIQQAHKLPRELYKSMTRGRGKELADVDDAETGSRPLGASRM
jgi:IS30 family transposase